MLLNRLAVDSDLTAASVELALSGCYGSAAKYLVVSPSGLAEGPGLARKFGLTLQMDMSLPSDAWYVYTEYFGVFSPGA